MPNQSQTRLLRNPGVDGLRILATMMVLLLHVLNIGKAMDRLSPQTPAYWLCMVLYGGAFCAVNCYGLISGYVGVYSRCRYARLALLWLQVVFYNLLGLAVWAILYRSLPDGAALLRAFSPLLHQSFWYFTGYFGLFFLMPLLNRGVMALTRKQARAVFWTAVILFSVVPTLIGKDLFVTQAGYSVIWLLVLYILGACIRRGEMFTQAPAWALAVSYGLSVAVALLVRWLLMEQPLVLFQVVYTGYALISYTAPTIVLCGVVLLVVFSRRKWGGWGARLVTALAPASFGIYILHMQQELMPLIFNNPLLQWISGQTGMAVPLLVLLATLGLYLLCAAVETLRQWLFAILKIPKALEKLENKLLGRLWDEA